MEVRHSLTKREVCTMEVRHSVVLRGQGLGMDIKYV